MSKIFLYTILRGSSLLSLSLIALLTVTLVGCSVSNNTKGSAAGGGSGGGGSSPGAAPSQGSGGATGWRLFSDANMELGSPSSARTNEHRVVGSGGGGAAHNVVTGTSLNYKLRGGVQ